MDADPRCPIQDGRSSAFHAATCSVLPAPFYDAGGITIYHGDNRKILPLLEDCDLLLTDPPYGIKAAKSRNNKTKPDGRWKGRQQREYYGETWDEKPADAWMMSLAQSKCQKQIIWGGNYYPLPPSRCWLVWDKDTGENSYADCELAWTNLNMAVRRIKHLWSGFRKEQPEERYHPTQKPLRVIRWALEQAGETTSVLDPWMGSGTTLVAAKALGMRAIGIEANETYCRAAVARLAQDSLPFHTQNDESSHGEEAR